MERKAVTKAGRRILVFLLALHGILLAAALMHQPTSIAAHDYAEACQPALQALAQGGDSGNASNCKIRAWYLKQVGEIPELIANIQADDGSIVAQAQCAFAVRHQSRITARAMMSSTLQVALLRIRDFYTYGHFDGPKFSQLVGDQPTNSDYEQVIVSASITDPDVNTQCAQGESSGKN